METIEKKRKLDLLSFQKTLNEQFLEVFENKKNAASKGEVLSADLGLGEITQNFHFFLPLKELKHISTDNNFEALELTKSWVLGFNQLRGEIFTIIDFSRLINSFLTESEDYKKRKITTDQNIIYVKNHDDVKLALVIETLNLEYTAEFTPLFKINQKDSLLQWSLSEDVDFSSFIKKENMSMEEWNCLTYLKGLAEAHEGIDFSEFASFINNKEEERIMLSIVSDVYLDSFGRHPVFVIDFARLTKLLINVSPF